jgi:hypothetical protein
VLSATPSSAAAAVMVPSLVAELPVVPVSHLVSLVHFCDVISAWHVEAKEGLLVAIPSKYLHICKKIDKKARGRILK